MWAQGPGGYVHTGCVLNYHPKLGLSSLLTLQKKSPRLREREGLAMVTSRARAKTRGLPKRWQDSRGTLPGILF